MRCFPSVCFASRSATFRSYDQTSAHGSDSQELCWTDSSNLIGFQHSANHKNCSSGTADNQAWIQVEWQGSWMHIRTVVDLGRGSGQQPYLSLRVLFASQKTGLWENWRVLLLYKWLVHCLYRYRNRLLRFKPVWPETVIVYYSIETR